MSSIADLGELETLGIWGWDLEDDDLQALDPAAFPNLITLDMFAKGITDEGVENIATFQLERLRISSKEVTDQSITLLQEMSTSPAVPCVLSLLIPRAVP